jgi:hypothetical protein
VVETDTFEQWESLPSQAETHGLGPLLYKHLKATDALVPIEVWRELKGLFLRHRHANAVRGCALGEILSAYQAEGIQALVLKGAALAKLVYPEPGLRPMRDVDLLVSKADAPRAQEVLVELGYDTDPKATGMLPPDHHHMPIAARQIEGMTVSVEVHDDIFPDTRHYRPKRLEDLVDEGIPFQVDGVEATTLGYEDMLWHVYRHACGPPLLLSRLRLVHMADMVSLVEKYTDQIDWDRLKRQYLQVYNVLPLLHFLTPWSAEALSELPFEIPAEPGDVGLEFQGWPRDRLVGRHEGVRWEVLKDTLSPPEWWLRLFYGVGGEGSWLWNRWVRHPLHVLEWVGHYAKKSLTGRFAEINLPEGE